MIPLQAVLLFGAAAALWLAPLPRAAAAQTADEWPLCHRVDIPADADIGADARDSADAPTEITADYGEAAGDTLYTVRGDVFVRRGSQQLEADRAVYDHSTGVVDAEGTVHFRQRGFAVEGAAARFDLATETGEIHRTRYQYLERHAHGEAETLVREGAERTQLYRASFTTCDPDQVDWELRARHVTLDQRDAVGTARGVTVRFKDVPFLYLPYLNFPLNDERKTGLLPPLIGHGNQTGLDLGIPFYWNIAPNRDATITPRLLENRGLLTEAEFRYLNRSSHGVINGSYLPGDALYGGDRSAFSAQHHHRLAARWTADANFNHVSDARYLSELGGSLATASTTHLDRRLDVNYTGDRNQFLARAQDYQTVDPTIAAADRPYRRLPQLLFVGEAAAHPLGADYAWRAEFVQFARDNSLAGSRVHVQPSIAWPLETLGYFMIPQAGLHYTGYRLDDPAGRAAEAPQHGVPIYSLDSGLFLERELALGGRPFVQTLEPRLYYLRIPFRDQSDFPVFDTTRFDFSYAQLFRENRYTNPDRIGDANQLSLGLTSRLLERDSGREWLRAAIGQIHYFEAPRVTLPGEAAVARGESDLIGELSSRVTQTWTAGTQLQWNPDDGRVEKGSVQLRYQRDARHLFNAGYRFRRGELDQTDFSLLWPLGRQWQVVGRWNYSLRDRRGLETLAGLQYDSCCWAFRITSRRYVNSIEGDTSQALYLQLELKGLASLGKSVDEVLEHGILGYRAR